MADLKLDLKDTVLSTTQLETANDLTLAITGLVKLFLGDNPGYQRYNDAVGALENAKHELYRRRIGPHNDQQRFDMAMVNASNNAKRDT